MRRIRSLTLALTVAGTWTLASCGDQGRTPTAADRASGSLPPAGAVDAGALTPFTYRASIDPYKIQQLPDLLIHERVRSDVVMQRSVFTPGAGAWHTHSGPSFVYVIQGQIKLQEYSAHDGCTETAVRGPGDVYVEEGDHVHRAVVVSAESAVLMVTRLNIPVGGVITNPVSAPSC